MATISYMFLGSSLAMVPTVGSMFYFVARPLVQNLHRTFSKAVSELSAKNIQCFQVFSGNKVNIDSRRSKGTLAYILTCGKKEEIQGQGQEGQKQIKKDNFDFYYYNSRELSEFIFPISTVRMSVFGNGEITIKLFWRSFGFSGNSVIISGNRDIEKIPWVGKAGKEAPFASFLIGDKFCQQTELTSWTHGGKSNLQCSLKDSEAPLIWREFNFSKGK